MLSPLPQSPAHLSVYHKRNVGSGSQEKDGESNPLSPRNENHPLSPEIQNDLSSSSLLNKANKLKSEPSSPTTQAFWLIIWMAK